jgi:hypothetical protein
MSALAACTSGEGGTAGNTELNVIVPNNESSPGVPAPIDIQTVEYTINCLGNSDTFLDNNASFPDEVTINGNLEVVDGRTDPQGPIPPEFGTPRPGDGAEVWQGFMDLPPGPCTVQLRARDGDGEVICTATEPFTITADTTAKVNLVLYCDVSFQAPVGMLDVDATFSFNVGNFCPDLFVLNVMDSAPAANLIYVPPLDATLPLALTSLEVRARDGDSTCGNSCDPQTCSVTPEGLTCTPGPDPGVSTTITCTSNPTGTQNETALLDCNGDFVPDASCTLNGDQLGVLVPTPPYPLPAPNPLLNASALVACVPPSGIPPILPPGAPGATITCTAVTTDGDVDCNKTKVVTFTCPGLTPCQQYAADGFVCDDGNECTADSCDNAGAVGGSCGSADNGSCCVASNVPDGTACTSQPAPAACESGVCTSQNCTITGCPPSTNDCLQDAVCSTGPACDPQVPEPSGTSCNGGAGACDGAGTCVDNCAGVDCSDGNECTDDVCDSLAGGTCSNPNSPSGTLCNGGLGSCNGSGACITLVDYPLQAGALTVGCRNNVTADISILPFDMTVDPAPMAASAAFTAALDGVAAFSEAFLDAAQAVVPGGVRSGQLVTTNNGGLVATVDATGAVTGADVALGPDPASLQARCALTGAPCTGFPALGTCLSIPVANNNCTNGFVDIPVIEGTPNTPGGCTPATPGNPPPDCDCSPCGPDAAKLAQCAANGFCVAGDLPLPLNATNGNYTAGATSGQPMYFDWIQPYGLDVDGTITLPAAVFANNPAPVGVRVSAGGLFVALQCAGAVDSGGPDGVGVLDDASPTPNANKIQFLVP